MTTESYQSKAARLDRVVFNFANKALLGDSRYTSAWLRAYYLRNYCLSRACGGSGALRWAEYMYVAGGGK